VCHTFTHCCHTSHTHVPSGDQRNSGPNHLSGGAGLSNTTSGEPVAVSRTSTECSAFTASRVPSGEKAAFPGVTRLPVVGLRHTSAYGGFSSMRRITDSVSRATRRPSGEKDTSVYSSGFQWQTTSAVLNRGPLWSTTLSGRTTASRPSAVNETSQGGA